MSERTHQSKMGFNATWSMAVGGMVGGGIFSVLGVVIELAGWWAWLSFVIAGLIALVTGYSYVGLVRTYGEGGGAFTFLREAGHEGFAGSLSWVLILGYVLTLSVYAYTFGSYLGDVVGLGGWFNRAAALTIIAVLVGVNLVGVGEASGVEVVTVWAKLAVLVGLACIGLWRFHPESIHYVQASPGGAVGCLIGAASIFMAYEGFQLLTYDYDEIENPDRTLFVATLTAIVAVIGVYVIVTLGASSLVGASQIVEEKEVALALAGEAAMGTTGKVLVSIAAAFSTASAINATLFATARLSKRVAHDGELPKFFEKQNTSGIPDRAVITLGASGAVLAVIGGLSTLVQAASLAFLFTFSTVNVLAALRVEHRRWLSWLGAAAAGMATLVLTGRMAFEEPITLAILVAMVALAIFGRPWILRHVAVDHGGRDG